MDKNRKYKLAIVASHPIQYQSPLWKEMAKHPQIDPMVFYCIDWGVSKPQFEKDFFNVSYKWDIPLLDGYKYKFLRNYSPRPRPGFGGLINPGIVWELWKGKYDAVLVMGWMDITLWFTYIAAKVRRTPILVRAVASSYYDRNTKRSKTFLLLKKTALNILFHFFIDGFMSIGSRNARFYKEYGIPGERIFNFPYGVDTNFFRSEVEKYKGRKNEIREEMNIPLNAVVSVFAARFGPEKHPEHVVKAFKKLRNVPNAILLMVGDGPMKAQLEKEVKDEEISNTRFLGFKNQRELVKIYSISDILVRADAPHKGDWGATVNEAMACGLPVVCTDTISSQEDLIERGENGFVYSLGDVDALSNYIKVLAEDSDLLRRMKKKSIDKIFSWGYKQDIEGIIKALRYFEKK